ncbi:hypothetical protein C8R43DRAFT_1113627 [Mycena crocata]|nr:hypothetical protein C8R43DRAFT_1113627 [Mycena crocata]
MAQFEIPMPSTMTAEDENQFMESLFDFEAAEAPPPAVDIDKLLNLLALQNMLGRLNMLRGMSGQGTMPLLELLRTKHAGKTASSEPSPANKLLDELLALPPAEANPIALAQSACAELSRTRSAQDPIPVFADPLFDVDSLPYISVCNTTFPRRKLHTPAAYTTDAAVYPHVLDRALPRPELNKSVWVSCFSDADVDDNSDIDEPRTPGSRGSTMPPSTPASSSCSSPLSSPPCSAPSSPCPIVAQLATV